MANYEELNKQMVAKMNEFSAAVDRGDLPAVERLDGEVKDLLGQMRAEVRTYAGTSHLGTSH